MTKSIERHLIKFNNVHKFPFRFTTPYHCTLLTLCTPNNSIVAIQYTLTRTILHQKLPQPNMYVKAEHSKPCKVGKLYYIILEQHTFVATISIAVRLSRGDPY